MRAAIYLRQSEDRDGTMLAVDRQREDCQKLCAERGWDTTEYLDNDTSATTRKPRPAYGRMLTDIRDGRIGAVVAWDADRLHRQPRELEDFIDLADGKSLALATVGGDFDLSSPTGRGNARMKGVFSRMEMEQKSARQKRANKQRAQAGTPSRSTVPFGYRQDGDRLVLEPAEAMMLRDAYSAILAGASLHTLAKQWNATGVKTRRGKQWSGATLRQSLMAHRNAGRAIYKGKPVTDDEGNTSKATGRPSWTLTSSTARERSSPSPAGASAAPPADASTCCPELHCAASAATRWALRHLPITAGSTSAKTALASPATWPMSMSW